MKIFSNIPFGIWIYFSLRHLHHFSKDMAKYKASGEHEKERDAILKATSTWGGNIVKKLNINMEIEGETTLPEGPVVFVSNHQGYGDIAVFCAAITTKQFGFVAKDDLGKIPYFGTWIRNIRSIILERDDPRSSLRVIESGIELIRQGYSLTVFPEGTRSKSNTMGEFKKGSLRLGTKPGVPVIPVTLKDSWRIFEEKGHVQSNQTVRFYMHPPIDTSSLSKQEANNLAETVENIIRGKLNEWNEEDK